MTARSDRALARAVDEAQERHARIWNAMVKRQEDVERKMRAAEVLAGTVQRAKLRRVK